MDESRAVCTPKAQLRIAVVGTGISGMSAAWLLSQRHDVTVYERENRIGGHTNTVMAEGSGSITPVDTGFIVYNDRNYPNLVALFDYLGVPTQPSVMSFSASISDGRIEYAGTNLGTLFAQPRNIISSGHWRMLRDLLRFYRAGRAALLDPQLENLSLTEFLAAGGYSVEFLRNHILPMGAAIWSTELGKFSNHSAAAFLKFFNNHGLLSISDRPQWRTVAGGSREYVDRLTAAYRDRVRLSRDVVAIGRNGAGVTVRDNFGQVERYDRVLIACHADEALAILEDPSLAEGRLLGQFQYQSNRAVLHRDSTLMPRRRRVWSSWNYLRPDESRDDQICVTYWMNKLQSIDPMNPLFVTLNPFRPPRGDLVITSFNYKHPIFDMAAMRAQKGLWRLQGQQHTWFAGAYFGSGFHEDGLQSGLAAAEAIGGVRRPWKVVGESDRIHLSSLIENAA